MADYYPIMLDLRGKRCVVIGGGPVAERKVKTFLECGALVYVISPELSPALCELAEMGNIDVARRSFESGDLSGAVLAVAATDESEVNRQVFCEGQSVGVLINVVDDPENCSFIVPSILRRGDITIAVSTSGRSPALARKIREDLEESYGPEYASLAVLIAEVRSELRGRGIQVDSEEWQESLRIQLLLPLLRQNDYDGAKKSLLSELESRVRR